ncbi:hypothetical protein VM1G_01381 [Cytospora mali]|uniref:Rhodopsin domain-containing protein n=1 Tax=Cytospora mali TaxID=578113 RepID=A0A194VQ85_CYTMA|nr:hypothetical protein VM1G_01381 [Valsa mali]
MSDILPQTYDQTPGHIVAATVVLCIIDILAVGGRFFARKKQGAPLKADDWLSAAALLDIMNKYVADFSTTHPSEQFFTIGYGILILYAVSQHSLGYRIVYPPDFHESPLDFESSQTRLSAITQFAYQIVTPLTVGCYKASILFFYLRIFAVDSKHAISRLLITFIILVLAWMMGFFFAFMFQCGTHVSYQWAVPSLDMAKCPHQTPLNSSLCISDFIMDVIILLIPVPLILRLNMTRGRRLAVIAVFAIGSVTAIASLVRMIEEINLVKYGFNPKMDQEYFLSREAYWVIVLMGTGTFSVCLPSLHPLLGSWSLVSIIHNTRSFFSFLSSKSRHGIKLQGQEASEGYDSSKRQRSGSHEHIRAFEAPVDNGYASSSKSFESGKVPRKTRSQKDYLESTTEEYAMSDMRHHNVV